MRNGRINIVCSLGRATLALLVGLSACASGEFHDEFTTTTLGGIYAPGSILNGQNGWVTMTDPWQTVCGEVLVDGYEGGRGWAIDNSWGNGAKAGVARDVSGDAAGGVYEVSAAVHGQYHAPGTADFKELHVGTNHLTNGSPGFSGYTLHWDDRNTVNQIYLVSWRNGVAATDAVINADGGALPEPFTWVVIGITVDLVGGTASAWWQETDKASPDVSPVGPRHSLGSYSGPMAIATVAAAGFSTTDYGYLDSFHSTSQGGVDLAQLDGWDIVVVPGAPASETYAAQELRTFISQAGGPYLSIVSTATGADQHIFVGAGADMQVSNVGFSVAAFTEEQWRIRIADDNIAIAGGQPRGTLYGVYTFVEDYLGVRFLTYDHTHVPTIGSELQVGSVDRSYQPPFRRLRYCGYPMMYNHPEFGVRMRNNAITDDEALGGKSPYGVTNHSFHRQVPIEIYGAGGRDPHPEYYGLWGGVRRDDYMHTHLCVTNDDGPGYKADLISIVSNSVIAEIEQPANADRLNFSVAQNDTVWQYCQSANCLAIDNSEGSHMGALLGFVNRVADQVALSYPDVSIGTLAYGFSRKPPATIVPRDNVQINLAGHLMDCQIHPFTDPTCPSNAAFLADLQGWDDICNHGNLYAWIYGINFYQRLLPYPNLYIFKPNLQSLLSHDTQGVFVQCGTSDLDEYFSMSDLRCYVIANLLWDPSRNTDNLIDEFVNLHYGAAAPYIRQFINDLHDHYAASGIHNFPNVAGQWDLPVDATVALAGVDLFVQAAAASENSIVLGRVEKLAICAYRAGIDYLWDLPAGASITPTYAEQMLPISDEFFRLCGRFTLAAYVADDRARIESILTAALPHDQGFWAFEDDFSSYGSGALLSGNNGWVDAYDMYSNPYEAAQINASAQVAEQNPVGWGTSKAGGVGRDISGDYVGDYYETRLCVYGQENAGYVDYSFYSVGDDSVISDVPLSQHNRHEIHVDNRNSVGMAFLVTVRNGVSQWTYSLPFNKDIYVWSELRITVDMDSGIASAWWRDVEDVTYKPFGDGSWNKLADFPGTIPYARPTAACFAMRDYARADNFRSGNMPRTCTEAISLGHTLPTDANGDCKVDLLDLNQLSQAAMSLTDLSELAQNWLRCTDPQQSDCEKPWLD